FDQNNGELENRREFLKGFYAGDTWRVTPRFTLNLGIRYEPYSFFTDTMDRNQTFSLANYEAGVKSKIFLNAPPGLLYRGDEAPAGYPCGPKIPEAVTCSDDNNLAPRVGLAWDPFGDGKTSIRAGYAIFYDVPMTRAQNNSNDVAPFSYGVNFYSGQLDDPYAGRESQNLFPVTNFGPQSPFPNPTPMYVLDSKWITSYSQNWSFTVEREIVPDTRLRVAYVGTRGVHLTGYYDQNAPIYDPTMSLAQNLATIDARRPIQGFEQIYRSFNGLSSSYNGLQISVDKRFSKGFSILGSYTWSKTLDYESVNDGIGGYAASYPFNFFLWRGPADQNVPHRFVTSFVWNLPGPHARSYVMKALARDWRLSGILTLQSGLPFDIPAVGNPLAGISGDRVNVIGSGDPVLDTSRSKGAKIQEYFDTSRFTNAAAGTIGTLGRNSMMGPGLSNMDVSLAKSLPIPLLGEAGNLELRLEAFNVFNRTNFNQPVTGLTNPDFGQLTSAGDPRILQLAVKVIF
ncbi:MAG TPA: TonB-dependent receptor, partial [Bryobacteraceae bacterium]|nr:TonB-dependent receptor [Bryobacteraceae bacterium]